MIKLLRHFLFHRCGIGLPFNQRAGWQMSLTNRVESFLEKRQWESVHIDGVGRRWRHSSDPGRFYELDSAFATVVEAIVRHETGDTKWASEAVYTPNNNQSEKG